MICIDGTFLTGRYKGQILTAIGVDCNNQIVPLAFAFVENENIDSWYWFLERVKIHVVAARPDVCLISDRLLARPSYRLEPQVLLCSC